ncbi:MAG: cbb3-type cytochrome oxidase assembly protein CcoS [Gammaproteobacteria bacterium]|jgi:cbb3-type cytochrome oxidase maturation protein
MEVIYALIPAMIVLGLVMVGVLVWAVRSGQYDDLEGDAYRIIMDDDDPLLPHKQSHTKPKQRDDQSPDADTDKSSSS